MSAAAPRLPAHQVTTRNLGAAYPQVAEAGPDPSGPLVVLDLSALHNSPAPGVLMACAPAWLQAALARRARDVAGGGQRADGEDGPHFDAGDRVLVVVDGAWAVASRAATLSTCFSSTFRS